MCARYMLTSAPEAIRQLFRYGERPNFPPRDEIFPSEPIAVVTRDHDGPHFRLMRWGFLPVWAKDPRAFKPLINARLETALEKPSFKGAMHQGRCLIPADGFYEWSGEARGRRLKHRITPASGGPVAFAGLWGNWAAADGSEIDGAAVLTCEAGEDIAPIHDRMPVVIPESLFDLWLDPLEMPKKVLAELAKAQQPRYRLDPPVSRPDPPPRQMDLF